MDSILNSLLVAVLALNLFALGTSRIQTVIRIVAIQGILIGLMPLFAHTGAGWATFGIALAAVLLKGVVIPGMLSHALRDASIKKEVEPLIGFVPSMILAAVATGFAMLFAEQLPLIDAHTASLLVPASLSTVLAGFILLTTRFKAISQVIGYLILENGIFIFGLLLVESMPLIVEMGVLLDLFVGIFVICIIVNHINRAFDSLDTRRLVELKE
jgi:hydrogenase-4 component E